MESQARDAAARLAALQSQLEASSSDCGLLRRQLEAAQAEAAAVKDQVGSGGQMGLRGCCGGDTWW